MSIVSPSSFGMREILDSHHMHEQPQDTGLEHREMIDLLCRCRSIAYMGTWLNMVILGVVTITMDTYEVETITCYNHITIL